MIRVKGKEEYTVWCENCKKTLIFDSPEDLIKADNDMYCIVCPLCKKEIWFHGLLDTIMNPIFTEKIKNADKNQQKVAAESFQKRLEEFGNEVQKIVEENEAKLQADSSPEDDLLENN